MWTVVGQDKAVETLAKAIAGDRVSHAYLFLGPKHVGKTTAALQFAQALNCTGDSPPCGECRSCRLTAEGKHPDVEYVTPGGLCDESEHGDHKGSRDIRICQVRRLERIVSLTPFEGRRRVLIVDPASALTVEAANAFLKTLEEPPDSVVIILVSDREEALPQTVRSRCRQITFGGIPRNALVDALVECWDVPRDRAEEMAGVAKGRLGVAISALNDESIMTERERALGAAERIGGSSYAERLSIAGEFAMRYSRDREAVARELSTWQEWWHDLLVARAGEEASLDNRRGKASQYSIEDCVSALESLERVMGELEENASPLLAFEALMLRLPRAKPAAA